MAKFTIEYTDLEETDIVQSLNEFADFLDYDNGDQIPLVSIIESDDVEDFVKEYMLDVCQSRNFDPEDTNIDYSW